MREAKSISRDTLVRRLNISLSVCAGILLLYSIWLLLRGALTLGPNGDAEREVRLLELVNGGSGGEVANDVFLTFNFGLAFQWFGHALNIVRENETFLQPTFTTESITVRHVATAIVALMAVCTVGFISWLLTRSVAVVAISGALLLTLPIWNGHGMMNQKDIPVAAGFTLVTAGLITWQARLSRANLIAFTLISIGFGLAAGVRPAMWGVLMASLVTSGALCILMSRRTSVRADAPRARLSTLLFAGVTGLALMVLLNPHLFRHLPGWPFVAVSQNRQWHAEVFTLTQGRLLSSLDLPASYQAAWFIASTPWIFIVLSLLGLILSVSFFRNQLQILFPLVFQALALPVAFVVLRGTDYDGFRHHLYVYPALATLAALAWFVIGNTNHRPQHSVWAIVVVAILTAGALLESAISTRLLWPYTYSYVNPMAVNGEKVSEEWETDYFGVGLREAIATTPKDSPFRAWGPYESVYPYEHLQGSQDTIDGKLTPEYWWIKQNRLEGYVPVPSGCEKASSIARYLFGKEYTIARIYSCA